MLRLAASLLLLLALAGCAGPAPDPAPGLYRIPGDGPFMDTMREWQQREGQP